MKCSKCYNEIPNDSKICPICQNIFATYFEEVELTKKQKIMLLLHKMLFPSIFIILIILLLFGIYMQKQIKMNRITDITNLYLDKNSENYVNELYISDGRHYKYLLNEKEKNIYNQIYNAIKNNEETVIVKLNEYKIKASTFTTETLKNIKNVLSMDHPELINISTISTANIDDTEATIKINYAFTNEEYETYIKTIKEVINEIKEQTKNMDDYNKTKYVYEWFYNNTTYNPKKEPILYSASGCFVTRECNQYGYSKAVQIALQNLNINSILATGSVDNKYHEWNIVKIENKYYYFDQTLSKQNKEEINYKGFLFKNNKYKLYHKSLMPKINRKKIHK